MDTSETTTHVGLCAGYGGIELGLKRVIANLRSVALCEIEAFACANLVAKMEAGLLDPAPVWSNLKTFPWEEFRDRVDILTGGYPCQPFSAAGKRLGAQDERHLWPFISAGIALMRPRICFFENVEGHISLGLPDVLQDLGGLGYRATWGIFSASETGAPHKRNRVFILAHRNDEGLEGWNRAILRQCACELPSGQSSASVWPSRPGQPQHTWEPPRVVLSTKADDFLRSIGWQVGDAEKLQRDGSNNHGGIIDQSKAVSKPGDASWAGDLGDAAGNGHLASAISGVVGNGKTEGRMLQPSGASSARKAEPAMGGDADGASSRMDYAELCVSCDNRTDELRLLGNGVVPATAELAFRTLIKELIA